MPKAKINRDDYFTIPDLRERGWTEATVAKLLGAPDELVRNPRYRSASPMRLYLKVKADTHEATPKFETLRERSVKRSATAQRAAAERSAKLCRRAEDTQVVVQKLNLSSLRRRAVKSWESRQDSPIHGAPLDVDRLAVNYLRHECSGYEEWLDAVGGKPGAEDARWIIRLKVYDAIAETYPSLAKECDRQIKRRSEVS